MTPPQDGSEAGTGAGTALRRCTGLGLAEFAEQYWSTRPLLRPATDDGTGFTDLLSPADIDTLVTERALREPFFRMVRDGEKVGGVNRTAVAGSRRISDLASPDRVREAYADGATLVLQSLHRLHPPLVRFCRALAMELGHPTQCNAYLTPPGSRGFAPHHDTHDVFVLQVDGSKRWVIYPPVVELPVRSQPSANYTELIDAATGPDAEPALSVLLHAGDALYVPRGWVHAAETNTERSVHLTVGVLATTGVDVLTELIRLAADEPTFRRALPLGDPFSQEAVVGELVRSAGAWLAELPDDKLRSTVRGLLARSTPVEPVGPLAVEDALTRLSKHSRVRPRLGLAVELSDDPPERVGLRLPDRELSLPLFVAPALRRLLDGAALVDELDLPVDDALVLVRRLLREGVLVPAE